MLDVHPPRGDIHSWKGFFLHIVTITIGLLIAIALEQSVEYVHHLNQLQAVRRELVAELGVNRRMATKNLASFDKLDETLARNMALLLAARASHTPPSGKLDYSWDFARTADGAWLAAKQGGALELMPRAELHRIAFDYDAMDVFMNDINAGLVQLEVAKAIARRAPDGALTPRDVDELITATSEAQGKLAFSKRILQFVQMGLDGTLAAP